MPIKQQYAIAMNVHNKIKASLHMLTQYDIQKLYTEPLVMAYSIVDRTLDAEFVQKVIQYGTIKRNARKARCPECRVQSGTKHNYTCSRAFQLPDDSTRKHYQFHT